MEEENIVITLTLSEGIQFYKDNVNIISQEIKEKVDELNTWLLSLDSNGKAQILACCGRETVDISRQWLLYQNRPPVGNRHIEDNIQFLKDLCNTHEKTWESYYKGLSQEFQPNTASCEANWKSECDKGPDCLFAHTKAELCDFTNENTSKIVSEVIEHLISQKN